MTAATVSPDLQAPLLTMRGIEKSFPGIRALSDVDLSLRRGEVLALLGENGAGKSTLLKILSGALQPDGGQISIDGRPLRAQSPADAMAAGIGMIYQELNTVPALNAWENTFLGREKSRAGFINRRAERNQTADLFDQLGVEVPLNVPVGRLSIAQQQAVEIAKALSQDVRILVMDEPSAALTPREVEHLFTIIDDLRSRGIGIIYISHRLDEIYRIADRVLILRDGHLVGDSPVADITRKRMIELMVGRTISNEFPKKPGTPGPVRLEATGLNRGNAVRDVSFSIRRGEVLGMTGLIGAGRSEVARLLFGADKADSGSIHIDGQPVTINNPRQALDAGICLLPEDRKTQGLVLGLSVRDNFGLPNLRSLSTLGWVHQRTEHERFASFADSLNIRTPSPQQRAGNLSGGNQQKIVLAKWLERNADVIIFDEPTRGIDVGAKYEIYLLINELASQGKAILMISSELPEVLGMSDRIVVMHDGRLTGEIADPASATQEQIMHLAVGIHA